MSGRGWFWVAIAVAVLPGAVSLFVNIPGAEADMPIAGWVFLGQSLALGFAIGEWVGESLQ